MIRNILLLALVIYAITVSYLHFRSKTQETLIRIKNASTYEYKEVVVGDRFFGDIKPGENSQYKSFPVAFRYDYIRTLINGEEFVIQPQDFVGESPLGKGRFSYIINANSTGEKFERLSLTYKEDK